MLAALASSGLVVSWWATRQVQREIDPELLADIAAYGWKWALRSTALQVIAGLAILVVLPREVLAGLMQSGWTTLVPLTLAIVLAVGLLVMLARTNRPSERPGLVSGSLGALLLTIVAMAVTRHQIRDLYLGDSIPIREFATAPQRGNFILFAIILVAGLGSVVIMARKVWCERVSGSEAA